MEPISAIIGAGANILGGLLGKNSADENRAAQERMAAQNIAMQKEYAQNAIQWKVADAQAAGIHPLYALGASTSSFSPVSIGSTADNSLGEGIARAGQNLERAFSANKDDETRALQLQAMRLDVETKGLQNDVLRAELGSKLARLAQPGTGPSIPLPYSRPPGAKLKQEDLTNQIRLFGKTLINDPYTSDAQVAEDVLGEGVSDWLWPFAKIPSLIYHNRGDAARFRYGDKTGRRFNP